MISNILGVFITSLVIFVGVIVSFVILEMLERVFVFIRLKFISTKRHIKKWNYWRKHNTNSKLHKVLVLLKLKHSPTFAMTMHPKEIEKTMEKICKGINSFNESLNQLSKNVYEAASALAENISKLNQVQKGEDSNEQE